VVFALIIWGRPTTISMMAGAILIILGEGLRLWSVAHTGKFTREYVIAAPRLVISGPYAYVRNPLYLGNILLYSGFTIAANLALPYLLFLVWAYFGFQYWAIGKAESRALLQQFGASYREYCKRVPAWLPRRPAATNSSATLPIKDVLRIERSTLLSIVAMAAVLLFRMMRC
jgi:protein-S-isoprenylcysteine O-methyltransferase Ste14